MHFMVGDVISCHRRLKLPGCCSCFFQVFCTICKFKLAVSVSKMTTFSLCTDITVKSGHKLSKNQLAKIEQIIQDKEILKTKGL